MHYPYWTILISSLWLYAAASAGMDAPHNPLQMPANNNPLNVTAPSLYQGTFSNGSLQLELHTQTSHYTGNIRFNGQQYPLQAQEQQGVLQGYFQDQQGHRFYFSVQHQGDFLDFETDGQQFTLQTIDNPTHQAFTPPQTTFTPPQTTVYTPNLLAEFHSLNTQIGHDFQLFMSRLRQWLKGTENTQQSKNLLTLQLLPTSFQLQQKLAQLGVLSSQMGSNMQLSQQNVQLMRQFITLSNKGSRFFEQWSLLLKKILELYDQGDQQGLYLLVQEQLPKAMKNAIAFARNFVVLVNAADKLQYHPLETLVNPENNTQPSLNPKQMFKWETLRNMSQMMRDAMQMISGARQ